MLTLLTTVSKIFFRMSVHLFLDITVSRFISRCYYMFVTTCSIDHKLERILNLHDSLLMVHATNRRNKACQVPLTASVPATVTDVL